MQGGGALIDGAIVAIEALAPSRASDQAARQRALDAARTARQLTQEGNAAAACGEWIKAADAIAGIGSDDIASVAAAQLAVARAPAVNEARGEQMNNRSLLRGIARTLVAALVFNAVSPLSVLAQDKGYVSPQAQRQLQ